MNGFFKDDYNLDSLILAQPYNDNFEMFLTPRFKQVYESGYEFFSTRLFKNLITEHDIFIDVGANYGYYTILGAKANSNLKVIAFEPIDENYQVLQRNIENNGFSKERVKSIQAAVSSKSGTLRFFKSEASDNGSVYQHPNAGTLQEIEVQAFALDDVLMSETFGSLFIKTDTDGNELEVLRGLKKTISNHASIKILLEMNPKMLKIAGSSCSELFDFLFENGFSLFAVDDNDSVIYPLSHPGNLAMMEMLHEKTYFNMLAIKGKKPLSIVLFSHLAGLDGAGRSLLDLVSGLVKSGMICNVVVPFEGSLISALREQGCGVILAPPQLADDWWFASVNVKDEKDPFISSAHLESLRSFTNSLRNFAPDYIISQTIVSPWGAIFAEMLGVPHALSAREYGELDHKFVFKLGFQESIQAFYQSSDVIFCITKDVKRVLLGNDVENKGEVIYGGIDLEFDKEKNFKSIDLNTCFSKSQGPIICMPASIHPGKGQMDLAKAVVFLRERNVSVRGLLIGHPGDLDYFEEVKQYISNSGFSESFYHLPFTDNIYWLLTQIDCVVSCSRNEALGRTLIEASLLEKPIIYSNAGGPKEIYRDQVHGLAYEPGNYEQLAACIMNVLQNTEAAEQRIQNAKALCKQLFSVKAYSQRVLEGIVSRLKTNKGRLSQSKPMLDLMSCNGKSLVDLSGWQSRLYWKESGEDFSAERVLLSSINFGYGEYAFKIDSDTCCSVRFDPIENDFITVRAFSVEAFDSQSKELEQDEISISFNGNKIGKNWEFYTIDPQITIDTNKPVKSIRIKCIIDKIKNENIMSALNERDAQLNQQIALIAEREKVISFLNDNFSRKEQELNAVYRSKAWKLILKYRSLRSFLAMITFPIRHPILWFNQNSRRTRILNALNRFSLDSLKKKIRKTAQAQLPDAVFAEIIGLEFPEKDSQLPDIVCFSIIDWEFRYQRPQQLMSQFAANGHRVFYINIAMFQPSTANILVRKIKKNIYEVVLKADQTPDIYGELIQGKNLQVMLNSLSDLIRECKINSAVGYVMISSWTELALEARRRFQWHVLYDCMDEWNNFPLIQTAILDAEKKLVQDCDLLVVTSQKLYDAWNVLQPNILLARNAADYEFYSHNLIPNEILGGIPHPIIGFYGAIADWFDIDLMVEVARRCPQYTFVLLGGVFDVDVSALQALPNVKLLGQQPYETMPKYLYHFDVCIIPFKINPITDATDPVKIYEYFCGGKPVVSVALPELNSYKELLYIAGDVDEFVEKLGEAVLEVNVIMRQRRVDFARQNSWHSRYQAIRSAILRMPLQEDVMRQFGISKNFILSYQNKWPELQWTKPNWQEFFNTLSPLHQMTVPFALSTVLRGRNVFKLLESNSYIGKKQRYLDIGTGYGGFLRAFKEQGFDEVVGIELQQQLAEFAKANTVGVDNAQVVVGNFVQDDFSYLGTFDVVTCNDVIEHVDDAGVAIRKMSELLCDGGCLCLEIPNKDFIDFVKSDGHFQIFGITQLDRGNAAAYYSEVLALDINKYFFEMGEMYELDWYVEHLADSGLSASMIDMHKVCEASDALGLIDDFERAYKAWHIVIKPQIGSAIAEKLMMAVDSYIRQLKLDYSKINDETSKRYFENKYLRSFWTIAAVKHKKR